MRNVLDRTVPLEGFIEGVNILSCNRREWEELEGPEAILRQVDVVAITDGPRGCGIHFRDPNGRHSSLRLPAFARSHPPRDTNRAGEAFASTLVKSLLESGWSGGAENAAIVRHAAERASAAAALVLDRSDFGFPADREIDQALARGNV
jgi:ribokinase